MTPTLRAALFALACAAPTAALACPDVAQSGQPLNLTSDQAFMPQSYRVVAGGDVDLGACGLAGATGHVITNPDFELTFTANGMGRALEFRVEAACDTVLLVNDANGNWVFSDDDQGLNPRIRIAGAAEGVYDIWVGTYLPETCDATLIVETF